MKRNVTVSWEVKKSFAQKIVAAAELAEDVGGRRRYKEPKDVGGKITTGMQTRQHLTLCRTAAVLLRNQLTQRRP